MGVSNTTLLAATPPLADIPAGGAGLLDKLTALKGVADKIRAPFAVSEAFDKLKAELRDDSKGTVEKARAVLKVIKDNSLGPIEEKETPIPGDAAKLEDALAKALATIKDKFGDQVNLKPLNFLDP